MRKIIAVLALCAVAVSAQADPHHGYRGGYHHHGGGWNWVVPAVIGGAVVYAATRPPVVVQQPPVYQYPQPPYGYHYENILDANCNCYRVVMVPN